MKLTLLKRFLIAGTLAAGFLLPTTAAEPPQGEIKLSINSTSRLWLEGDSTLHPYSSTATLINATIVVESDNASSSFDGKSLIGKKFITFNVDIPVEGLKSKEKALDKNLHKTLKAPTYPTISFQLSPMVLMNEAPKDSTFPIKAEGKLSIAGKENTVSIDAIGSFVPEGLHIQGSKQILMTDYGVKPPTMLGVIKTKNEVMVRFDLVLAPIK